MAENDNPHLACPYIDCGSSDAFNWNDDGYGHCHSCGNSYPMKNMPEVFDCGAIPLGACGTAATCGRLGGSSGASCCLRYVCEQRDDRVLS